MDLFKLLGSGAHFDKKKFGNDIELFQGKKAKDAKAKATNNAAATDPKLRSKLLNELDILSDKSTRGDSMETEIDEEKSDNDSDDNGIEKKKNKRKTASLFDVNAEGIDLASFVVKFKQIRNENEAAAFRKAMRIRVYGTDIPNPFCSFEDLASPAYNLRPQLYANLKESHYKTPTPIQTQSIPIMLKGRDLMACAPTGSGKTLSYLLPILQDLGESSKVGYRAMIIAPTRELAQQIHRELVKISAGTDIKINLLTKATSADKSQARESRQKFDILISTPKRLIFAIREKQVDLSQLRHLVLDEADKLMDFGFLEQTDEIFAACSAASVHKYMFSATFTSTVEELARTVMKDPIEVVIGARNAATDTIKQELVFTGNEAGKMVALRQYIQTGIKPPVLIFVQSIERAKELFHELVYDGINVEVIHSDRTKTQRDNIINQFRLGRIWVLIATDLMARGLDFKGVNLVINYDIPQTVASYIHRIGRTGRAGRAGEAVTYYTKDDMAYLRSIVNVMKESGCEVPEWMLKLKKPT
ncbi:P-loop containing nucleoside triphosphate hydrolase protein [Dichotomocladium elegans]|nr:P-loop containing nucleoside triphosphate hydrolase protein [Dichotomocladium elegans]